MNIGQRAREKGKKEVTRGISFLAVGVRRRGTTKTRCRQIRPIELAVKAIFDGEKAVLQELALGRHYSFRSRHYGVSRTCRWRVFGISFLPHPTSREFPCTPLRLLISTLAARPDLNLSRLRPLRGRNSQLLTGGDHRAPVELIAGQQGVGGDPVTAGDGIDGLPALDSMGGERLPRDPGWW